MGFVGIEEIFLKVQDLDSAIDFYHNKLGIPLDKHDHERAYLQCDRGHLVLQIANSTGRIKQVVRCILPLPSLRRPSTRSSRNLSLQSIGRADRSTVRSRSKAARCLSSIRTGTR